MNLVIDASVVVAAMTDGGEVGEWAHECLATNSLSAPHLLPVEIASALRRLVGAGALAVQDARRLVQQAGLLDVDLYPFSPFSDRVWALRDTMTAYDAWYVAVAEAHESPLATLDLRLVNAPGTRCDFVTPAGD